MMRKKRMNAAISSWQGRFVFAAAGIEIFMAVASSFLFATELEGLKKSQAQRLDTGWAFFLEDTWEPIEALPCTIDMQEEESLILQREVTEEEKQHAQYVLALRSRYASVQVWADEALIYEAAQGRRHALGSMWHFIPASSCRCQRAYHRILCVWRRSVHGGKHFAGYSRLYPVYAS